MEMVLNDVVVRRYSPEGEIYWCGIIAMKGRVVGAFIIFILFYYA